MQLATNSRKSRYEWYDGGQWKVRGQTESRRNPRTSSQVAAAVSRDGDMSRGWQAPSLKAKSDDRLAKEFEKKKPITTNKMGRLVVISRFIFPLLLFFPKKIIHSRNLCRGVFFYLVLAVWFIVVWRERIPNPETLVYLGFKTDVGCGCWEGDLCSPQMIERTGLSCPGTDDLQPAGAGFSFALLWLSFTRCVLELSLLLLLFCFFASRKRFRTSEGVFQRRTVFCTRPATCWLPRVKTRAP